MGMIGKLAGGGYNSGMMQTGVEELLARLAAWRASAPPGRPWVTLSWAQSLDGSLTAVQGQSTALSGAESLRMTHALRAQHAAILVGVGTVLADDPRLNVRLADGPDPRPVILDSQLRTPPTARCLARGGGWPLVLTTQRADGTRRWALEAAGATVLEVGAEAGGTVALGGVLAALTALGMESVMVEGGARVLTAFLRARLADALIVTVAPVVLGGYAAVQGAIPAARLDEVQTVTVGNDLVMMGRPRWTDS